MTRLRIKHWIKVIRLEQGEGAKIPWWRMIRALLGGVVPREVWVARMRRCMTCPLYSTVQLPGTTKRTDMLHLCKSAHPRMLGAGCHCAVNMSALTANPYGKGCYGRELNDTLGWGPYIWPSRRSKVRAVICFILDIRN